MKRIEAVKSFTDLRRCKHCETLLHSFCPRCGAAVPDEKRDQETPNSGCWVVNQHRNSTSRRRRSLAPVLRFVLRILVLAILSSCNVLPNEAPDQSRIRPLHVLILQDVSLSVDGRVPRVSPDALEPLLDDAEQRGGVVALGTIGVSTPPFVRVVFDRPADSDQRVNVFLRHPANESGDTAADASASLAAAERERFLSEATTLLERSANQTNLVAALHRAELFFAEAPPGATQALLLISDLQDTTGVGSFNLSLDDNVRLLLVAHSAHAFVILADQASRFACFESVGAAVRAAMEPRS